VIYGDGTQSRDFTYVRNNIEANILACTAEGAEGKVFNIACGINYDLLTLVKEINNLLGKNVEPVFEGTRTGDVMHSLADISRAASILGYTVKVDFKKGLEKTVAHFLEKVHDVQSNADQHFWAKAI
jgi:UDP-glucose 4-epimerase